MIEWRDNSLSRTLTTQDLYINGTYQHAWVHNSDMSSDKWFSVVYRYGERGGQSRQEHNTEQEAKDALIARLITEVLT